MTSSGSSKKLEPSNPVGTVMELFAGVGGFRLGLSRARWKTIFSNQWEPATKSQLASDVYVYRFGSDGHSNVDIAKLLDDVETGRSSIPAADLLVGGFPCQDYSVAKTLNSSAGLQGSKGVLWWEILRLVRLKRPKLILLENVDRLLKSPARQRGRDFAVMLASLADEGYLVEWRVVNAADYGANQRRKRVFLVAKRKRYFGINSKLDHHDYLLKSGSLARSLPVSSASESRTSKLVSLSSFTLDGDLAEISQNFGTTAGLSPFRNCGLINGRSVSTLEVMAADEPSGSLGKVLLKHSEVPSEFFVSPAQLKTWRYLKGAKRELRTHPGSGAQYHYAEGSMAFPDLPENPSRTILTGEGGSSPSRFKHIVRVSGKRFRRLTPVELERLNGFPDDWTRFTHAGEVSESKRAFFMGNALVVDIVERIGKQLAKEFLAASGS